MDTLHGYDSHTSDDSDNDENESSRNDVVKGNTTTTTTTSLTPPPLVTSDVVHNDNTTTQPFIPPTAVLDTSQYLQPAPPVSLTAGRFGTSNSTTTTSTQLVPSTRKRSSANDPSSLILMNNPRKDVMYQPVQGPQATDPNKRQLLAQNNVGTLEMNVTYDITNFHEQRTLFQKNGIAYAPNDDNNNNNNGLAIRTTVGYSRERLQKMVEKEMNRPIKPMNTKQNIQYVDGSDDEIEYGVWGPPTIEEQYEKEHTLSSLQLVGGNELELAPEQLMERKFIAERNRQKGIEEQQNMEEMSYDRMVERKMAHLLPPVMNNNNNNEEFVPSTIFHGTAEYDYKGRSWLAPPAGLGAVIVDHVATTNSTTAASATGTSSGIMNSVLAMDHHKCYLPKKCVHRFTGHNNGVHRIRLFPITGHLLLSAGLDGKCKVWSVPLKQVMRTYIGHTAAVRDVQFNHNGTKFLSASFDRYIRLWDTESGTVIRSFTNRKVPYVIQFYPLDDNYFVVGCSDSKIITYNATTGEITQEYNHHLGPVNSILFVPNSGSNQDGGVKMITSSDDKKILVWEWDIGVPIKYISDPSMQSIPCLVLHPNQQYFVGQSLDNTIVVFSSGNSNNGRISIQKKKKFTGHVVAGYACEVTFSVDGQFLVSGDGNGNVYVWDYHKHTILQKYKAHTKGPAISCVWHPIESSTFFTCGWDGIIKMWQ